MFPVDNVGTVVGENPTPYGILALWVVNSLPIVYWAPAFSGLKGTLDPNRAKYLFINKIFPV